MTWSGPDFDPRELQSDDGEPMDAAELAALNAVARQIAGAGRTVATGMPTGFSDRVMAAVATEPLPSPVAAVRLAFVKRRVGLLVAAVRGSTRMIAGPAWPGVVRAQALGVVLAAVLLVGSASTIAVVGASALLGKFDQSPSPSPALPSPSVPAPTASPTAAPSGSATPTATMSAPPSASGSPSPGASLEPSGSPEASGSAPSTTPGPTAAPTPRPTASPSAAASPTDMPGPTDTPGPTNTPGPTETLKPAETLKPGQTLKPGETLKPAETPRPSNTPHPT